MLRRAYRLAQAEGCLRQVDLRRRCGRSPTAVRSDRRSRGTPQHQPRRRLRPAPRRPHGLPRLLGRRPAQRAAATPSPSRRRCPTRSRAAPRPDGRTRPCLAVDRRCRRTSARSTPSVSASITLRCRPGTGIETPRVLRMVRCLRSSTSSTIPSIWLSIAVEGDDANLGASSGRSGRRGPRAVRGGWGSRAGRSGRRRRSASWRLMPSLRQSVATSTRFGCSASCVDAVLTLGRRQRAR